MKPSSPFSLIVLATVLTLGCNQTTASKQENENQDPNVCSLQESAWIFCDDFESGTPVADRYFEYNDDEGDFVPVEGEGWAGGTALRTVFQAGEVGAGDIKKSIGRTPDSYIGRNAEQPDRNFSEIYWRVDVRLEDGWTGGGGHKLTRATTLASDRWAQGFIAHLWSGGEAPSHEHLVMDPASGIDPEGNLVTSGYNDFDNLRWLGSKRGGSPLFNAEGVGRWHSIEAHVKLNTPGESDGVFEFWVDGEMQAGSYDLNWHGDWNEDPDHYGINAIFFENYWNGGAPATQSRYFDNIIISTERIGAL